MDDAQERELTLTRLFDAPRELVFKAWTDPELLRHWAAPRKFRITHQSGEVTPGGAWRCCMSSSEGAEFWLGGQYEEIIPPERLVFTHAWDEEAGYTTLVTVTFEDVGGKTLLTLHQAPFKSRESRDGHEGGWSECFDILAELLAREAMMYSTAKG